MFEIVILGSSASAPSVHRGLSAAAVLAGEDRWLVDCGEGTQRQIFRSGIGFKRLNRILLTHGHLDHLLGLGGIVSTYVRWEALDRLDIWGSEATLERVHALIYDVVLRNQTTTLPIDLHRVRSGPVHSGKRYEVTAFPVTHRGRGCFGYVFKEEDRRPFLVEKAEVLGIPIGPERGRLVRGESITLSDGRIITPDMVLGDNIEGAKVVFTGDVGRTDNLRDVVANADVLVIEATFLDADREMANRFGHITAHQAAELARDTGVRNLLLTHLSRRYREYDIIAEARAVFPSAIVVRDLDHYIVRRGQAIERRADPLKAEDDEPEIFGGE